jgi:hypothetical protein
MNLSKFIHTKSGKILASVILGLGLASLFRKICRNGNCIVYKAPPFEDIIGKIFEYNDECYIFEAVAVNCDKTKQIVEFA